MSKGQKTKSATGKFAKSEEHSHWAIRRRQLLKEKAITMAEEQ